MLMTMQNKFENALGVVVAGADAACCSTANARDSDRYSGGKFTAQPRDASGEMIERSLRRADAA